MRTLYCINAGQQHIIIEANSVLDALTHFNNRWFALDNFDEITISQINGSTYTEEEVIPPGSVIR
jgi:hypothetical protein